jgi:spermidine synthase
LKDTRVNVRVQSVVDVIVEEGPSFDAIILDTDNGPDAIVHSPNHILYKRETMIRISQRLLW